MISTRFCPCGLSNVYSYPDLQIGAFGRRRKPQPRCVAQLPQSGSNRQHIAGSNQEIEIGKLAQSDIAIKSLCQNRPLVRQDFETSSRQMTVNVQ